MDLRGHSALSAAVHKIASLPVFIPKEKEPNFFARYFHNGWDWYARFFASSRDEQILGEGSTWYTAAEFAEAASTRITEHYPEARFIFIARDPIQRLESSFREMHDSGDEYGIEVPYFMGDALRALPNMIEDTLSWQRLCTFRQRVPDSRILTVFLKDLQRQPATELARCFEFLGVDPSVRIANLERKNNPGDKKMYDSRLLRFIRRNRLLRERWQTLSAERKAYLTTRLRPRKPFKGPVRWDARTRAWVLERIGDDARQFLAYCGKPADYWELS